MLKTFSSFSLFYQEDSILLNDNLDELRDIFELIDKAIVEEPPMTVKDGGIIKIGYDPEIDTLKRASTEGKSWLAKLEADEKEKTGIKNLKVGFNKVFGYYIEVSKGQLDKVKDDYSITEQQYLSLLNTDAELARLIGNKVQKIEGKGLSTEDFTTAFKDILTEVYLQGGISNTIHKVIDEDINSSEEQSLGFLLSNKVDKIDGKGLSSNDFADVYLQLLQEVRGHSDAESEGRSMTIFLENFIEDSAESGGLKTSLDSKSNIDHLHDDRYALAEEGKGLSANDFSDNHKAIVDEMLEEVGAFDSAIVDYYVAHTSSDAMQIEITADKFGGNYYLEASTLFRDTNGVDMPAEFIIPNCKIQSNFTFSMASSGDPSTFTFTMDAFPDYTRFDKSKKVLAAIQVIKDASSQDLYRKSTAHSDDHDVIFG